MARGQSNITARNLLSLKVHKMSWMRFGIFFTRILKKQTIPVSSLKGSPLMLFCKEKRTKTRDTKSITHWALPAEQGHLRFQLLLKHHRQPQKTVYSATSCWEVNPQCSQHTTFRKFPVVLYYSSPYLLCAQQKSHIRLKAKLLSRRVISWVQKNNFALEVGMLLGGGKMEEWKGRGRTANSSPGYPSWRHTWERNQKDVTSEAQEIQKHVTDTRLTDLQKDGNLLLCQLKVESQPERCEQPPTKLTEAQNTPSWKGPTRTNGSSSWTQCWPAVVSGGIYSPIDIHIPPPSPIWRFSLYTNSTND